MKIKPAKKLGQLMREVDARTEPRVAAALFRAARKLPAVRLKKLLATTDFSEASMEGVHYAVSFASRLGATLDLAHIVEPVSRFSGMSDVVLARGAAEVLRLAEKQAARLATKLSGKNLAVTAFVRSGKPFNEIAALAGRRETDLVVIATHGHTGLKRVLLGSTAERVVRHAPCPVLTIPAQAKKGRKDKAPGVQLRRVIVPIDFSETSVQALPYAAALAKEFGAEVVLLHVIEPLIIPSELGYVSPALESATLESEQALEAQLSRLGAEVFNEDLASRTLVRVGIPPDEITKAAGSLGGDMIILTTHGYTGLKHALLGSTAERVVRHAPCPVLVVRQDAGRPQQPLLKRVLKIRRSSRA